LYTDLAERSLGIKNQCEHHILVKRVA